MKSMMGWEERMMWVKSGKRTATCDAVFAVRHGDHFVDVEISRAKFSKVLTVGTLFSQT